MRERASNMAQSHLAEHSDHLKIESIEELIAFQQDILFQQDPNKPLVIVCHGTGCLANGSPKVSDALRKAIVKAGFQA
jgi:NADH:ubiquinone oxidoreductase subunit E